MLTKNLIDSLYKLSKNNRDKLSKDKFDSHSKDNIGKFSKNNKLKPIFD